ncbi:isoform 4 of serine/threonine-protein phosphatase 6 regulatory ankyrin repeat subunit a [Fagus crenata]
MEKEHVHMFNPILIAAKNGITEIVEKSFEISPMVMNGLDQDRKNIVLLTVEHKQPHVYVVLLDLKKKEILKDNVFREVDRNGDSALHFAAKKADFIWPVPGAASQMQWDIKWYEYINNTTGKKLIFVRNKKGKTPDEVFTEEHEELVKEGGKWLSNTSNACSVVAGLFVTVTFTTSSTVPDSVKQVNKDNKAYKILAGSSFVSFCASLVAVVMFLAILTSGYRKKDFRYSLLKKLLLGLTAFYVSIASTLISFCSGHFSIFKDVLKSAASSSYLVVCLLLITFFAFQQLPLYVHLLWATFKKVPQRNYRFSFPR